MEYAPYFVVLPGVYQDSINLMRVAGALKKIEGIQDTSVVLGTDFNLESLLKRNVKPKATSNDIVISVWAVSQEVGNAALDRGAELLLAGSPTSSSSSSRSGAAAEIPITSIVMAKTIHPTASLALISVPGIYAYAEAKKALNNNLHVMLFSDNVSVEDERELKILGLAKKRLVMGPDCGTCVLDGFALGFANAVKPGGVGIVGSSGTGVQEVSCQLERFGQGISQMIGVGGRDMSTDIGGLMTFEGLRFLVEDTNTRLIVLVCKSPAASVAEKLNHALAEAAKVKPVVVCYVGSKPATTIPGVRFEPTLFGAAVQAAALAGNWPPAVTVPTVAWDSIPDAAPNFKRPKKVLGLYSGGTLKGEAYALAKQWKLHEQGTSIRVVDLGDDEYTVGRAHPMIDYQLRNEWIVEAARTSECDTLLLDVVLGHGSHLDPMSEFTPAFTEARRIQPSLRIVAGVVGVSDDPQGRAHVIASLRALNIEVAESNYEAVVLTFTGRLPTVPANVAVKIVSAAAKKSFFDDETPMTINVGLGVFELPLKPHVVGLEWRPPANGDVAVGRLIADMAPMSHAANALAVKNMIAAVPWLMDVQPAGLAIGMKPKQILHAGPPISWDRMCDPMKGACIGACLFEGWTQTADEAETLLKSGGVELGPCHSMSAVGPMAGIISPSMKVWVVQNKNNGGRSYCTLNEGLGEALRFGAFSPFVLDRLKFLNSTVADTLGAALRNSGGLALRPIMAKALHMGDECHNRNAASTSLLLNQLTPHLFSIAAESPSRAKDVQDTMSFMSKNDHFVLNISMAASKCTADAGHDIAGSTIVTAMARNGVDFGIRVSGFGSRWFTAPAPMVDGLFLSGFTAEDANPDMGDSSITETVGLGGFSMVSAPAIMQFVGGTFSMAQRHSESMGLVCNTKHPHFTLPALGMQGIPFGLDLLKVVDSGIRPVINTGIAHKRRGVGQVGAGITAAPLECFFLALKNSCPTVTCAIPVPFGDGAKTWDHIKWEPFRPNVEHSMVFKDERSGNFGRYVKIAPNADIGIHVHHGYEYVFVLFGGFVDERGTHGPGTVIVNPPSSSHSVRGSPDGCINLVIYDNPPCFYPCC